MRPLLLLSTSPFAGLRAVLRWFTLSSAPEAGEVRHAMLLTLREPSYLTWIAFFWTQTAALFVWFVAGQPWALAWLALDLALFVGRLRTGRQFSAAEGRDVRLPTGRMFAMHSLWMATMSAGSFGMACEADVRLVLIGTILPIGFCGYVVSRWQAFPRCASAFLCMLCLALFGGFLASPLRGVAALAWLIPAGAVAFHGLLRLNHRIIIAALRGQQESRRQSMHDPLTDLPNRVLLRDRLGRLYKGRGGSGRQDGGFAVLCVDLDGFKEVNDRHGHATGDKLLKSVARRLSACLRGEDIVCRLGGDEFVVVLSNAGEAQAIEVAERILASTALPHDLGARPGLSARMSIGIAIAPRDGSDPESLLAAGDSAMYEAKRAGKSVWRRTRTM